jgi:hypothetical protein
MDLNEQVDADFTRARRRARLRAVVARLIACLVRVRVGMVLYAISYEKDISN